MFSEDAAPMDRTILREILARRRQSGNPLEQTISRPASPQVEPTADDLNEELQRFLDTSGLADRVTLRELLALRRQFETSLSEAVDRFTEADTTEWPRLPCLDPEALVLN